MKCQVVGIFEVYNPFYLYAATPFGTKHPPKLASTMPIEPTWACWYHEEGFLTEPHVFHENFHRIPHPHIHAMRRDGLWLWLALGPGSEFLVTIARRTTPRKLRAESLIFHFPWACWPLLGNHWGHPRAGFSSWANSHKHAQNQTVGALSLHKTSLLPPASHQGTSSSW